MTSSVTVSAHLVSTKMENEMLEFGNAQIKRLDVYKGQWFAASLASENNVWILAWYNNSTQCRFTSDDMRQIASKLEELNGK